MFVNEFGETNWVAVAGLVVFLIAIGVGVYFWINRDKGVPAPGGPAPGPALGPAPGPAPVFSTPSAAVQTVLPTYPQQPIDVLPTYPQQQPIDVLPTPVVVSPTPTFVEPIPAISAPPAPVMVATGLPTEVLGAASMAPWGRNGFVDAQAQWIWTHPGAQQDAIQGRTYDFEKVVLNNGSVPIAATFHMHFDDIAQVYVNDVLIGTSPRWETLFSARFNLVPGPNVLRVRGKNVDHTAGFLASIVRESDGSVIARTDSTWVYRLVSVEQPIVQQPTTVVQQPIVQVLPGTTTQPVQQPVATSPPSQYRYVGCFNDRASPRAMSSLLGTTETKESCIQKAKASGFKYGGLQWFGECYGSRDINAVQQYGRQNESECRYRCTGSRTKTSTIEPECGGDFTNAVYEVSEGFANKKPWASCRTQYGPKKMK
jgi:hypothetical protein